MNLNELLRDIRPHVLSWINTPSQGVVTAQGDYNVFDYGAVGDDTHNDSPAFQAAVDACTAAGGGTVLAPGGYTYLLVTGIVITSLSLTSAISFNCHGAILHYTGSGHGLSVLTNCSGMIGDNCYQYAERATRVSGLYMVGTVNAISGIYVEGAVGGSYRDVILDSFTSIVEGSGALKLYVPDVVHWVEQNTFENFEIRNTGNGIVGSSTAPCSMSNNYFKDINIWVSVNGGRGLDFHITDWLLLCRCTFEGVLVHPFSVNDCICFDLGRASVLATVFICPSVDVYGWPYPTGIVVWNHTDDTLLPIIQGVYWPTPYPDPEPHFPWKGNPIPGAPGTYDHSFYTGGGKYTVLGPYGEMIWSPGGHITLVNGTQPAVGTAQNSPTIGLFGQANIGGTLTSAGMRIRANVDAAGGAALAFLGESENPVASLTEAGHFTLVNAVPPTTGVAVNSPVISLFGQNNVADVFTSLGMRLQTVVHTDGTYQFTFISGPDDAQVGIAFLTNTGFFWTLGKVWAAGGVDIGDAALYRNGVEIPLGAGSSPIATDPIWDAAGDLVVGSGPNTAYRLPKGADGTVLSLVAGWPNWVSSPPAVATDPIWDAAGDLAVGTGADTAGKLAKGADGTLLGVSAGAVGWVASEGWTAPTLLNSWVNYDAGTYSPAGYYKDSMGMVHIRGMIKNGTVTAGTAFFVLPAGYRPYKVFIASCASNDAYGETRIRPNGSVEIEVGSSTWLSMDNISFRAEN